MTGEHETVQLVFAVLDRIKKREDARRGNPLRLRRTARELAGTGRLRGRAAGRNKQHQTCASRADPDLFEKCSAI